MLACAEFSDCPNLLGSAIGGVIEDRAIVDPEARATLPIGLEAYRARAVRDRFARMVDGPAGYSSAGDSGVGGGAGPEPPGARSSLTRRKSSRESSPRA